MIRNPQPATSQPSPEHNLKKYVAKENAIKIIFKKKETKLIQNCNYLKITKSERNKSSNSTPVIQR